MPSSTVVLVECGGTVGFEAHAGGKYNCIYVRAVLEYIQDTSSMRAVMIAVVSDSRPPQDVSVQLAGYTLLNTGF